MIDVVVTVPKAMWAEWIEEGDLPGEDWSRFESHFWIQPRRLPRISNCDRVYVVAYGRLRGYSPLVRLEARCRMRPDRSCLVRRGGAVAVTIPESILGFQGWRYRWWDRADETPFPDWRKP